MIYKKSYLFFVYSAAVASAFALLPFFTWLKETGHGWLIPIVGVCIILAGLIDTADINELLKLQLWAILIGAGAGLIALGLLAFPANVILFCASMSIGIACVFLPGWIAGKMQTGLFVVYRFPFTNKYIITQRPWHSKGNVLRDDFEAQGECFKTQKEKCAGKNRLVTAEILSVKKRLKKGRVYLTDTNQNMYEVLKRLEQKGAIEILVPIKIINKLYKLNQSKMYAAMYSADCHDCCADDYLSCPWYYGKTRDFYNIKFRLKQEGL